MAELATTSLINDANLQGYYKLESGAITTDSSSNGRTLTNNGSVTSVAAKYGNGISITANTQWLSIGNNMNVTGNMSMGGWFKMNTAPSTQQYNICFQEKASTNDSYWIDYEYNGGTPRINFARFLAGVITQYTYYTVTLDTTDFHHFAMTYDGTNVRGYFDGSKVVTSGTYTGNGIGTGTDEFLIAKDDVNGDANSNHGIYDDIFIFNRVLTDAEILTLYNPSAVGSTGFMTTNTNFWGS